MVTLHGQKKELANRLLQKTEGLIIKGLRLKGYEFSSPIELGAFISTHCKIEQTQNKDETYSVDGIPFLFLSGEEIKIEEKFNEDKCVHEVVASKRYKFL